MIYGIPSYRRPQCRTVDMLLEAGVSPSDIVVSLQDEDEIEQYKKFHSNIRYVYRKADSAAGNRNTLLMEIKERPFTLLDDDIFSFSFYDGKKGFHVDTAKCLKCMEHFAHEFPWVAMIGMAATNSNIIAKNRDEYSPDTLLQGTVCIVLKDDIFYDESFKQVEDYELCLRLICQGKPTLRMNYFCANKPKNGTNEGGMHERYKNNELPFWLKKLERKYPNFKANKKMDGGSIVWR